MKKRVQTRGRILDIAEAAVLGWRHAFLKLLKEICRTYPPREPVDIEALADMVSTVTEGIVVLSETLRDPKVFVEQVMLLRSYIRLLFQPEMRPTATA